MSPGRTDDRRIQDKLERRCGAGSMSETSGTGEAVAIKGKPVRNRRGPATVSGEPSPCRHGSHWERSREGWATASIHESGDLVATSRQTSFREKRSGHAIRGRGPGAGVAAGDAAGGRPGSEAGGEGGDEERGSCGCDGDH